MIANSKLKTCGGNFVDGKSKVARRCPLFSSQHGIMVEDALLAWENSRGVIKPASAETS